MKKFCGIKAILFDIDDTLFPSTEFSSLARKKALNAMIFFGMKASKRQASAALDKIIKKYGSNYPRHFDILASSFECDNKNRAIAAAICAYHNAKSAISPYPQAKKALLELKRSGYILAIASEGRAIKQWDKLIRLGLGKFFSCAFVTSKKSPAFYRRICAGLKLEPNQLLMVGDNPQKDILFAKKAGLHSVRLMLGKHRHKKGEADANIGNLSAILPLL